MKCGNCKVDLVGTKQITHYVKVADTMLDDDDSHFCSFFCLSTWAGGMHQKEVNRELGD